MNERIDIHSRELYYNNALSKFRNDNAIIPKNKELILQFLKDCELGKTVKHKAKKKIGVAKRQKYLDFLRRYSEWFNKPFNKVAVEDVEKVISNLESNKYKFRRGSKEYNFSQSTKLDYKKALRKFYKWLLGNNEHCPELVDWIDVFEEPTEIPALSRDEIEKMANSTDIRNKAIIMLLFDSGARVEEFLNIRLNNITKEDGYYILRIEHSKTKARSVSVPMCSNILDSWLVQHPDKDNPKSQLFPITYDALRLMLNRTGKNILKKNVNPHLLRHTSATYYANKLNYFQLCYRYGWSMASKQPARYIDRAGIQERETIKIVKISDMNTVREENQKLKEEIVMVKHEISEINKKRKTTDDLMAQLLKDTEVQKAIMKKITEQELSL